MKITLKEITIRELVEAYSENMETGRVCGFGGNLDIRPVYQREFVYGEKQRVAVIDTVFKAFPLNVMYWAGREDGTFEIIDGQQRTISICQFVKGEFSFEQRYFHNLQADEKVRILDYKLTIYVCCGSDSEKLDWFRIINIAGEKLTDQELRNAVYAGTWTTDAKRYFSKNNCAAYGLGGKYLSGSAIRQDYLETTINWISDGKIEDYMAQHQHDENASPLWQYFQTVINWVQTIFPKYRKEMKGIAWGILYNRFREISFNAKDLDARIAELMEDVDVTKKNGIYEYVLGGDVRCLSIRAFDDRMKREAYERQNGICPHCKERFAIEKMEADHITPWHEGGKTVPNNCQMLCKECNRRKGGK